MASHHVTNDLRNLSLYANYVSHNELLIGGGKRLLITNTGSSTITSNNHIALHNFYVLQILNTIFLNFERLILYS